MRLVNNGFKKKAGFFAILLILLLSLNIRIIPALTATQGIIFRCSTTNTRYTLGSNFDFYQTEINSSHLWLDQSYTTRYLTQYCLIPHTSNVNWTVNTWFAAANSSATLTLIAPTLTSVQFSFHSPNLLGRPTVLGATGQT